MPTFVALACLAACLVGCSGSNHPVRPYGAQGARLLLIDVDVAAADPKAPHAKPEDIRFGLYGAPAHPMEAGGLGSCDNAMAKARDITSPLSAPPDRLTWTVCLGPLKDRSEVRGVYTYSPRDRMPKTTVAYGAAFPVGVLPTNGNDTGVTINTTACRPGAPTAPRSPRLSSVTRQRSPATATCCWGFKPTPSRPGTATTPPAGAAR
jgi:hypothetical protein